MKLPQLNEIPTTRTITDIFKGYNHNLRIGDGEFYDMKNLTSSDYPVLSPRPKRGIYKDDVTEAQGLIAKDSLCYVDGGDFVINDYRVAMGLSDKPKTLVSMGAYVIIMPDKMYVNTKDNTYGNIEANLTTQGTVHFTLSQYDGNNYDRIPTESPIAPDNPSNLALWIDTSSEPHTLKQYSEATEMWVAIATSYIKIENPGIGLPFNEGDGVTISGITVDGLKDLNNTMVIWAKDDREDEEGNKISDWILVTGLGNHVASQEEPITIKRLMPELDFVIESENRLWGCRYGVALNGEVVNEIYASKLGDFKNWNCFAGISTDSYVASVGTDGQFTGAITHLGYPIFFKENCMHKVYGNYPANYQIQTTTCRGVQKGCSKSLSIVNEVLYYKSQKAICSYDGSLPMEISSALGEVSYSNAVGGSLGNKYYISMQDMNEQYHLFVYDTVKGMWHREDNLHAKEFCTCRGELYFIEGNKIKTVLGTGTPYESNVKWMAETGIIGTDSPDKKYISRLDIRLSVSVGTRVHIFIQYDSSGEWEHKFTMTGRKLGSFSVPIRPRRCDHLRLRIEGDGEAKIYSIYKTIEQGSNN